MKNTVWYKTKKNLFLEIQANKSWYFYELFYGTKVYLHCHYLFPTLEKFFIFASNEKIL